jgi:ABC-type transporter Mla MlaB component
MPAYAGGNVSDTQSDSRSAQLVLRPLPDLTGFAASGEIDASNRLVLATALAELISGEGDVHLDLGQVRFVDVGTATLLVSIARRLTDGRQLLLHHPPYELSFMFTTLWPGTATIETDQT